MQLTVLSRIDDPTKHTVYGWIRNQQSMINLVIPTILYQICLLYYFIDEIFVCDAASHKYMSRCLFNKDRGVSIIDSQPISRVRKIWPQIIYGMNEIMFNNEYFRYIYEWKIKIHQIQCVYQYWPVIVKIGFEIKDNNNKFTDLTYGYCNDGELCITHTQGFKDRKMYGHGFGSGDTVSVSLNSHTKHMKVGVNITSNTLDQGIACKIFEKNENVKIRLKIIISGPNTELEIIKFSRKKY